MSKSDIEYYEQGMFVAFIPTSNNGEALWNHLAQHTDGTGKVLKAQAAGTIAQMREAGYTVRKMAKTVSYSKDDVNALFRELT